MDLISSCLYTPSTFAPPLQQQEITSFFSTATTAKLAERSLEVTTDFIYNDIFGTLSNYFPNLQSVLVTYINTTLFPGANLEDLYVPIIGFVSIVFISFGFLFASGIGAAIADTPQLVTVLYNRDASGLSMTALSTKLFALSICFTKMLLMCLDVFLLSERKGNSKNNNNSHSSSSPFAMMTNFTATFLTKLDFLGLVEEVVFSSPILKPYYNFDSSNTNNKSPVEFMSSLLLLVATIGAFITMMQTLFLLLSISVFNQSSARWPKFSLTVWFLSGTCGLVMLLTSSSSSISGRTSTSDCHQLSFFSSNTPRLLSATSQNFTQSLLLDGKGILCTIDQLRKEPMILKLVQNNNSASLVINSLNLLVEYFAFICCILSPVWFWYFNYKHKATRRFSKVSQILHSIFSFIGVLLTGLIVYFLDELFSTATTTSSTTSSLSSLKKMLIINLVVGMWNFIFHLVMVFQVIKSDRDDAVMKQRMKVASVNANTTNSSFGKKHVKK